MINIILPVVENAEKYLEFIDKIKKNDVKIFVGVRQSLADRFSKNKNIELHVFNDKANKEEIINSLHSCKLQKGKILIVRRPLNEEEYNNLTSTTKDIATLKAKRNGFVEAIKRFAMTVVRKFFAFSYFEDISAIFYNESMFELLSVCSNHSMASRVNKYVGLDVEEFTTTEKPVKKDYNKWKNALMFTLWCILLIGSVVGGVLVCVYVSQQALIVILVMCWIFVALMFWGVGLINFTRTVAVGDLRYGRAEEIIQNKK